MAQCFACRKKTNRYEDVINCANKNCGKVFHPKCVNEVFTDLNRSGLISKWLCEDCRDINENLAAPNDKLDLLIQRVGVIYEKVNDIDFKSLVSSVKNLEDTVQSLKADLIKKNEEIEELKMQHEVDRKHLLKKLDELEYFSKKKNILINGLPFQKDENLWQKFNSIQKAIAANITDDDITDLHRLSYSGSGEMDLGRPPPVIVAFKNVAIKKEFMMKKKGIKKTLTTTDIGLPGPQARIFFNDQLTERSAILFRKARARKSTGELAHVWTDAGKVLVRKTDGGRVFRIFGEEDFPA